MKSKFGQKLLSWLLTAGLLVGLLPTAAFAADEEPPETAPVSVVEEQPDEQEKIPDAEEVEEPALYEGEDDNGIAVQTAINADELTSDQAWNDGDTISVSGSTANEVTLTSSVKNVTVNGTVNINNTVSVGAPNDGTSITISGNNDATLKLAQEIKVTTGNPAMLAVYDGNTASIKNITFDGNSKEAFRGLLYAGAGSSVTIENATFKNMPTETVNAYVENGAIFNKSATVTLKGDIGFSNNSTADLTFQYDSTAKKFGTFNLASGYNLTGNIVIGGSTLNWRSATYPAKIITGVKSSDVSKFNLNSAASSAYELAYADGNIYICKKDGEKPTSTTWAVDLGSAPSGTTVSGDLSQRVTKGNAISKITIKPNTGKYTDASAVNEALNGTGLTASVNANGEIEIAGTPTSDVSKELSAITWPTPVTSAKVTLTGIPANTTISNNGQTVEAGQALNPAITIKANDGYMPFTSSDAETVKKALNGKFDNLTVTCDNGVITINGTPKSGSGDISVACGLTAPVKIEATSGDKNYATVGGALTAVSSGKITAIGTGLTPVSDGKLQKGVSLETKAGTVTANGGTATIDMDKDGNVTLSNGKLEVTGAVKASIGGKDYAFTGDAGKTYTVDTASKTLTVPAGTTVTDGNGVRYTGQGTFTFNNDKVTVSDGAKLTDKNGKTISGVTGTSATQITLDNGAAKLTGGKGSSTGKMDATIKGIGDKSFEATDGNKYTVDTDAGKLTLDANGSVKMGDKTTFTGKANDEFDLAAGADGNTTAAIPADASVSDGTNTVKGVAKGEGESAKDTKVSIDKTTGKVTLVEGKGASNGKMDAKVGGKDMSFDGNGKEYVVDTDGKLTINDKDASVKADKATFTAGKAGETFDLTKDSEGTVTATLPEGAYVKGDAAGSGTITGAKSEKNEPTQVTVDKNGNATLIKGAASVPAGEKITAKIGDKTFDISSKKAFTVDLTKVPPQVGTLNKGETITVGGITYTCDSDEDDGWFPIESDKAQLKNNGDKAEVKGGSAATVKLGTDSEGKTAPTVTIPDSNKGSTKLTKGQPSTVELGKTGDTFKVGDKTYAAASDGAKFNIDDEGNVSLAEGAATVKAGDSLGVKTGDTVVPVTAIDKDIVVKANDSENGKSSATVPADGSVTIGDKTYPSKADGTKFVFDESGDVSLAAGKTALSDGNSITGSSGKLISNPADSGDDEIEVTANSPENGKDTVKVPADGKVKIGDTEYDAGANGATIIAGADSNKLTEGSVKLDKPETVSVGGKDTPVKNTGDKQIEVSADGKVTVPAGGELEIGAAPNTAKITDVTEDTTFNINDNGKTTVDLPAGGSVTINGVTYTDDGSGSGKLTIDENGKVTVAENVKVAIDENKLADENFEYDLIPGVPVTVGKYTYTAPKTGSVGDVKLIGRGTDAEGKVLNPAIDIKNNGGTVEVALKDKPETKTEYTAANAGTKFAMSANDTDTTKIDLLDNNNSSANSALKFTDKIPHTVNGVTYEGQEVKDASGNVQNIEYTVSFGEASVDSGKKNEDGSAIMETVNRNKVDVASGSKVSATMDSGGTISIGSGKVGDKNFTSDMPFTASNSGASILIDNTKGGTPEISGNGRSYVAPIYGKKSDGTVDTDNIIGYQVTRRSGGGGSSSGSSVGVKNSQHGKITVSPSNASQGTTVTITAKPDSGYKLGSLTVTDKNGNTVKLTQKSENVYTFVMPAGAVSVEGTFVKVVGDYSDCEKDKDCPIYPFADAQPTAWYHDGVHYCLDNGLMVGVSDNKFAPNGNITRGQIVTILWRQSGAPTASGSSFVDVASNAYYAQAVAWASQHGIVSGYNSSKFGPEDPVTREQLAAILYRYAQFKGMDTTQGGMAIREYSDYDSISAYALQAMQWAVSAQVITGTSSSTLSPAGTSTRAQAACMMQRFLTSNK